MATRNEHVRTKARSRTHRSNGARLRRQAMQVGDNIHEMGNIARGVAQEKLGELRENAAEYYEMSRGKMEQVERTLEQYICDRPMKSILIAAGVGLLIGRFMMGRSS